MRYLLGDPEGDGLEIEIISIDRNSERSNAVMDLYVRSGSYRGDSRFVVDYSDFVLFYYQLSRLADGEDYLVPELIDRQYGSSIDVADTVGGLFYDDRRDGAQSLEFDFAIDDAHIIDFVQELRRNHFTYREIGGVDFDIFLTALLRLEPEIHFSVRQNQDVIEGAVGRFPSRWKSKSKPQRKGPWFWLSLGGNAKDPFLFESVGDLLSAPVFSGETLFQVWNRLEITTIDGIDPQERLSEGFLHLGYQ
jgi:hypothetical protein